MADTLNPEEIPPVVGKIFRNLMNKEKQQLTLESRAGVPLGTTPYGVEPAVKDEQELPGVDVSTKTHGLSGKVKHKKFTRTTEHFTIRINQLISQGLRDPLQVLMEIATGEQLVEAGKLADGSQQYVLMPFLKGPDHKTRALAAAEVASYLYPKRKAIEVSGNEGQPITFQIMGDTTEIPVMPSESEIQKMMLERRQQAAQAEQDRKTILGN